VLAFSSMTPPRDEPSRTKPDEHPVLRAIRNAPIGEPFSPEHRADLDRRLEDIRLGRVELIPHEEVHAQLEERARELGEQGELDPLDE